MINAVIVGIIILFATVYTSSSASMEKINGICEGTFAKLPIVSMFMGMICGLIASIQNSLDQFTQMEHQTIKNSP